MSNQVFEQYVDEHGNISVRVSQDVVVLTREDADRVKAKSDQLKSDNAKLRELAKRMFDRVNYECHCCSIFCSDWDEDNECCVFTTLMRELGVVE